MYRKLGLGLKIKGRSSNIMGSIGKLYIKQFLSPFYTRICNNNPRKMLPRIIKNSLRLKILKNFIKCIIFINFLYFHIVFPREPWVISYMKIFLSPPRTRIYRKNGEKTFTWFFKNSWSLKIYRKFSSLNTYMAVIL